MEVRRTGENKNQYDKQSAQMGGLLLQVWGTVFCEKKSVYLAECINRAFAGFLQLKNRAKTAKKGLKMMKKSVYLGYKYWKTRKCSVY